MLHLLTCFYPICLQGPLTSLTGLAHVMYRFSTTRLYYNSLGMSDAGPEQDNLRVVLRNENDLLRRHYNTLM